MHYRYQLLPRKTIRRILGACSLVALPAFSKLQIYLSESVAYQYVSTTKHSAHALHVITFLLQAPNYEHFSVARRTKMADQLKSPCPSHQVSLSRFGNVSVQDIVLRQI